jgi:hypothetical protein
VYAVVNHLQFVEPADALVDMMREGVGVLSTYPGFHSMHVVKEDNDRLVLIMMWQTQQDAESAAASFGPAWFGPNIGHRLYGPQRPSAGPVVASTTN